MASPEREALRQAPAAGLLGPGLEAPEIAAALAQLSQDPDVQEIRLFGSRARSEARPGSDLDLLLILTGSHTAERERQLRARTRALLLQLLARIRQLRAKLESLLPGADRLPLGTG